MKHNILRAAGVCLAAFITFSGAAQAATETFDTPVVTGATQAPGTWYTDRYAPAGFSSPEFFDGDNRLKHSISDTDGASDRPAGFNSGFYDTQGRKFDLSPTNSMSIDLFVAADWGTTGRRMAGFWGEGFDGVNPGVAAYPILEFTSDGGTGRFRGWDSATGMWTDMGLPSGFSYDSWNTLGIELAGGNFIYTVGDLSLAVSALGSTSIDTVILQGHNNSAGVNYDIYWDNLSVPAGAIPEPATWAMMIGGFGLVGGAMRRRRSTVRFVAA